MRMRLFAWTALAAALCASVPAQAHGPRARVSFGVVVGGPLYWGYPYPYYYPPPYGYYPAPVYHPAPAPVYVERDQPAADAPAQSWWYYCEQSRSYYPYVKTCPGGWQRVAPTPPSGG